MTIKIINAGEFLADGGAMFGVVPKVLWQKKYPADENNQCKVIMRSLLIDDGERVFLIDNGCGNKLSDKFYVNNNIEQNDALKQNLQKAGYTPNEITDVLLTHLHFDHCGGSTYKNMLGELQLTFPHAKYHTTKAQFENMTHPTNIREGSAMFKDDIVPVFEAGKLLQHTEKKQLTKDIGFGIYNGHTPGQIIPWVKYEGRKIHFTGDLVPLAGNVPTAWVSAYDCYPVVAMEEKVKFLEAVHQHNDLLFFEHDYYTECAEIQKTTKGFKPAKTGRLSDFI